MTQSHDLMALSVTTQGVSDWPIWKLVSRRPTTQLASTVGGTKGSQMESEGDAHLTSFWLLELAATGTTGYLWSILN